MQPRWAPADGAGLAEPGAVGRWDWWCSRARSPGVAVDDRTDAVSRELIDDIQPARVAAYQLQAALRDQETAVRGYVIAADTAVPRARTTPGSGPRRDAAPTDSATGGRPARTDGRSGCHRDRPRRSVADVLRRAPHRRVSRRACPGADSRQPPSAARPNSTASGRFSTIRTQHLSDAREHPRSTSSMRVQNWRDGVLIAMVVGVLRRRDPAGAAGAKRRHPPAGRTRRGVQTDHRGQLRRTDRARRGPGTSARSLPTSRTCGSGSSTNWRLLVGREGRPG